MSIKLDDELRFNEMSLSLRIQRQKILASNIVNEETPHYKARDIDFAQTLQNRLRGQTMGLPPVELAMTSMQHIAGQHGNDDDNLPLMYRTMTQGNVDGNTVDMDVERHAWMTNELQYETSITAINRQIKDLLTVIQPG